MRTPRRSPDAPADAGRLSPAGVAREPGTARIAVDLLGGDDAPAVVVDGALRALRADPDLHLLLVGPIKVAGALIDALDPAQRARISVRPADTAVDMADDPTVARTETTVRAAVAALREGLADALVSAGSTGATVTAAALGLGRWPQVRRPALAAVLPAVPGPVVLLDVGGSLESSPATLTRHAVLGAAYATVAHGAAAPRVGLLSVGTEPGKGDRARRLADPMLSTAVLPGAARYVGLVEGYDVCLGTRADVVVTDGFTGNVLLKAIEGAYAMAGGSPPGGGAPRAAALLGVAGTVVVCHGAARADDITSGIALAAHLWRQDATDRVAALIAGDRTDRTTDTEVRTS
ncbi:glycerol-3-phosphate acyltransferase PlsX [Micromonospora phaseoli]|uniref:Phosphate acyltransferase n=1 Tax=Micromonospora phaseoli TaxID=1144548 RepID=A0A1H6RBX0_9ACTN|nr:phosphate:acyl-[acyl carrier protein] acyltransferase [Micromonospora phaseoli]SEI53339.1 glycerol-3-phosphate acyltransferase PlsX [Micromonospora phaseoli]